MLNLPDGQPYREIQPHPGVGTFTSLGNGETNDYLSQKEYAKNAYYPEPQYGKQPTLNHGMSPNQVMSPNHPMSPNHRANNATRHHTGFGA